MVTVKSPIKKCLEMKWLLSRDDLPKNKPQPAKLPCQPSCLGVRTQRPEQEKQLLSRHRLLSQLEAKAEIQGAKRKDQGQIFKETQADERGQLTKTSNRV